MNRSVLSLDNTFLLEPMEIAKTLEIGLYHRFKKDLTDTQKENPFDFEHFIAEVFKRYYGGHIKVTKASGDMGVDIIHYRPKGLILGQVKCYAPQNNVGYETIAILHSQIRNKCSALVLIMEYLPISKIVSATLLLLGFEVQWMTIYGT